MKLLPLALIGLALALAGCATANTGVRTTASVVTPTTSAPAQKYIKQPYTLNPDSSNYWIKE